MGSRAEREGVERGRKEGMRERMREKRERMREKREMDRKICAIERARVKTTKEK